MDSTKLGAPAAYRGYRLQALYILYKLLTEKDGKTISPERAEDLSIKNQEGKLTEIIQVKAYSSKDLGFSDLKSNTDSVFKRLIKYKNEISPPQLKVVSFNAIGPELLNGFGGKEKEKRRLVNKLKEDGFNTQEIEFIFDRTQVKQVSEEEIRQKIDVLLQDIPSGSSLNASFDLLNHWLYKCSEFQIEITKETLIEKLLSIGKDVNASIAYQQHWYKTIVPLNEEIPIGDDYREAFYNGSLTKFSHIISNMDIKREEWITKLKHSHEKHNLIILHGPSGQGKTTLAFRYMYECFPEYCRIEIKKIKDVDKALEVAQALSGFATRVRNVPIGIYLDISPREINWIDLVRELANIPNIYILVTIREEDWKRASIETDNLLFIDVMLDFSEQEAEHFFISATKQLEKVGFLDFEDAWLKFGAQGPLLEFAYFLNNEGVTLKDKIRKQILRIEDECRNINNYHALDLLKLVAVASKYNCRLTIAAVIKELKITGKADIDYLEGEFLLKINQEENMFEGLHQIRSSIIESLLVDELITCWNDLAKVCLRLMPEEDIKTFLMNSFYDGKIKVLTEHIFDPKKFNVNSWIGVAGVLESLLWLGVYEYYLENNELISELKQKFNRGWAIFFSDVAQVMTPDWNPVKQILTTVKANEEQMHEVDCIKSRQTNRDHIYKFARQWLSSIENRISAPSSNLEWSHVGLTGFWIGKLVTHSKLSTDIEEIDFNYLISGNLSSKEISQVVIGLLQTRSNTFDEWYQKNNDKLIVQYRKENNVLKLEDKGNELTIYTLIEALYDGDSEDEIVLESNNNIHDTTMNNILILRKLVPTKEIYSHQGVGHKFFDSLLDPYSLDDSRKNIPIENLPLEMLTSINSLFRILVEYGDRPETWEQFFSFVIERRNGITDYFNRMNDLLFSYHKTKNADYLVDAVSKLEDEQLNHLLQQPVLLPQSVMDAFSGQDESSWRISKKNGSTPSDYLVHLKKYASFLQSIKAYFSDVSNFLGQSKLVFLYHCRMIKNTVTPLQKDNLKTVFDQLGYDDHKSWVTFINIKDAVIHLQDFQLQFEKVFRDSLIKDPLVLSQFTTEETETMMTARSYWFELINNQERVYYHPKREILRAHKELLSQFNNKILEELTKKVRFTNQLLVRILEEEKLFVIEYCYEENILLTFSLLDELVQTIRKICENINLKEFIYYEMEMSWSKFVFIPQYKGKSVLNLYWEIPFYVFTSMTREVTPMHFIPKKISNDLMGKLGIHKEGSVRTEESTNLLYSFMSLTTIFKHLNDIKNIHDTDGLGIEISENYLLKFYSQQSDHYQKMLDTLAVMLNKISSIIEDSQQESIIGTALLLFQEIQKIQSIILPDQAQDGKMELEIRLSEIGKYVTAFESISMNIWTIVLLWIEL